MTEHRRTAVSIIAAAAMAACAASAGAAEDADAPWQLYLQQGLSHESNVMRAPEGEAFGDTLSDSRVGLDLNLPFGRQRLRAQAEVNHLHFADHDDFNTTGHDAALQLLGETAGRLKGEFGASSREQLYRYTLDGVPSDEPNTETLRQLYLRARVGVVTEWTFEAGAAHRDRDYSLAEAAPHDQRQSSIEGGLRWQPSPALGIRAVLRHTDGSYPRYMPDAADDYSRNDIIGTVTWRPSGASSLQLRLGRASEDHSVISGRDESLWTGALSWDWQPTGKLRFQTRLLHDNDTGTTVFDVPDAPSGAPPTQTEQRTSDARISTALDLRVAYAASEKVLLQLSAGWLHRDLDASFSSGGGAQSGTDNTRMLLAELTYLPTRSLRLGCGLRYERRSVSDGARGLSDPYDSKSAGCLARYTFG